MGMREYFDVAYNLVGKEMVEWIKVFARVLFGAVVIMTMPIWIIPYLIINKRRGEDNDIG